MRTLLRENATGCDVNPLDPALNCDLCPRLTQFRKENQAQYKDWFNAPVPSFGDPNAELLIIGLAPGLKGANRTGRPFTGDFAGHLLYSTLLKYGFAKGRFEERIDDSLTLVNCKITNAVRCVPPENKPTTSEIKTCQQFLNATLKHHKKLKVIIALGKIAHDSFIEIMGLKKSAYPFGHTIIHQLNTHILKDIVLIGSYHCSKYNTSTKRLTEPMFHQVFEKAIPFLK